MYELRRIIKQNQEAAACGLGFPGAVGTKPASPDYPWSIVGGVDEDGSTFWHVTNYETGFSDGLSYASYEFAQERLERLRALLSA